MVFWFFRKKSDDEIRKVHHIMDKSFSNIKKDIGSLSSWITHFKGKHDEHEGSFDKIMKDIESIKDMFENHMKEHHSEEESPMVFNRSNSLFNRS